MIDWDEVADKILNGLEGAGDVLWRPFQLLLLIPFMVATVAATAAFLGGGLSLLEMSTNFPEARLFEIVRWGTVGSVFIYYVILGYALIRVLVESHD